MSPPRMTRDQLRGALTEAGVKTNAKTKKEDLVKLYNEKVRNEQVTVVPANDSLIGGFSSDDEEEPMSVDTSHINHETNVADLTNDEIFCKLKDLGESVGPILDTTRSIYERKLSKLLGADEKDGEREANNDISAFSADEAELDKDETDEYEPINEDQRTNGHPGEQLEDDADEIPTRMTFSKIEDADMEDNLRFRNIQPVKTGSTDQMMKGKSFIPPPPRKQSYTMFVILALVLVVVLVLAAVFWFNFYDDGHILEEIREKLQRNKENVPPLLAKKPVAV